MERKMPYPKISLGPMDSPALVLDADEVRALAWAEIAGLIEINADGSWQPTAFGRAQLLKLDRGDNEPDRRH
jgi:hypothetical protein